MRRVLIEFVCNSRWCSCSIFDCSMDQNTDWHLSTRIAQMRIPLHVWHTRMRQVKRDRISLLQQCNQETAITIDTQNGRVGTIIKKSTFNATTIALLQHDSVKNYLRSMTRLTHSIHGCRTSLQFQGNNNRSSTINLSLETGKKKKKKDLSIIKLLILLMSQVLPGQPCQSFQ